MDEYLVPSGYGEDVFVEKKSRFIGRVWLVETLHSGAQVLRVDYTGEGIEVEAILDPILYGRLKGYITNDG